MVVAGGELKLQQLDLTYDASNRYYEAPLPWSERRGLRDRRFGRQEVRRCGSSTGFIVRWKRSRYLDIRIRSQERAALPVPGRLLDQPLTHGLVDEAYCAAWLTRSVSATLRQRLRRILATSSTARECVRREVRSGTCSTPCTARSLSAALHPVRDGPLVDLANYRQEPPRITPQT